MDTTRWHGLEVLEPRLLMSGDPLALGAGLVADHRGADATPALEARGPAPAAPELPPSIFAAPLGVDPAAPAEHASADPEAYLVLQGHRAEVEVEGLRTDAISISDYALVAGPDVTLGHFILAGRDEVRAALGDYLARRPWLESTATVVVDIEGAFGTGQWHRILDRGQLHFELFAQAFRMRLEVVRELLPHARISLYGFEPQPWGDGATPEFQDDLRGVRAAAALGMLDPLDAISPALYNRYGPTDARFGTIGDATRLALDSFGDLARSDGSPIDLFPLLALNVFNGGSAHRRELLLDFDPDLSRTVNAQIDILRAGEVRSFGIWQASGDLLNAPPDLTLAAALGRLDLGRPGDRARRADGDARAHRAAPTHLVIFDLLEAAPRASDGAR